MEHINYDNIADIYARNRPPNSFVVDELRRGYVINATSRVLEVGCGTGSHLQMLVKATGCQGSVIDPSEEMIRQGQNSENVRFFVGAAEELPFQDKYFDFLFSVDVIHYVKSLTSYFREAFRVLRPGGTLCTVTDSETDIRKQEPLSKYWPSRVNVDLKRYPAISRLKQQMSDTGFINIEERQIQGTYQITDITPYQEKAFSCLHLIPEGEYLRGLQNLQEDLKVGPVQRVSMYTCLWGHSPAS
jgi:SAM-dependent methyltransferase